MRMSWQVQISQSSLWCIWIGKGMRLYLVWDISIGLGPIETYLANRGVHLVEFTSKPASRTRLLHQWGGVIMGSSHEIPLSGLFRRGSVAKPLRCAHWQAKVAVIVTCNCLTPSALSKFYWNRGVPSQSRCTKGSIG